MNRLTENMLNKLTNPLANTETTPDPIVKSVLKQFELRSILGVKKYGTTLQDNDTDDFLQHLKEELMDAVLYIEKLQSNAGK